MSVSEHVSTVISSCAKSIYATRTLRSHSMNNKALHDLQIRHHSQTVIRCQYMVGVYNSYRPSASRGTYQTGGIRSGLCGADVSTLAELVDSADDALFQRILHNPNQVLHSVAYSLLPDLNATGHILDIVVMTEFYRQRLETYRLIFF